MTIGIKYCNQHANLPLVLVERLTAIKKIKKVLFNFEESSSDLSFARKLQAVLDDHSEIEPGLHFIKGVKAKLELKEGATPKIL